MEKNRNFRFFGTFLVLVTIILSIYLVLAVATPTSVTFEGNTTNNYDKEGVFTVNWTVTGDTATSQVVYISADDSHYTTPSNNSAIGYSFSNTTEANYSFIVEAENATGTKTNSSLVWMIVDTTDPTVSYTTGTPADNTGSNTLTSIFVNVSVTEANEDTITFEIHNSTALVNSTSFTDATRTINFTGLPINVAYTYNVTVNDSATRSFTATTRTFTLDNVAPSSVTLTKASSSSTSLTLTISVSDALSGIGSSCTVDRSGASVSGTGTSQTLTETGLSCGKSYSYTVTCTDGASNSKSSSATSFSTTGCGSGGVIPPKPKKASHSWSKMTPGVVTIMKNFDAEMGVKEIKIGVNNEAQSVSITVTKYDGKPAAVTVEKSGKVYKYLQVETTNLADKLSKATVTLQVEKSWLSSNGLDTDNVALFRFDESADRWNELATIYIGPEGDNELYDVELTSFSFFAIGEKAAVVEEKRGIDIFTRGDGANLVWLWVLIAIVVLVLISLGMKKKKQ